MIDSGNNLAPSTNGSDGRGDDGKFTKGNRGGPGNPHAKKVQRLRATLLTIVTPKRFKIVVARLFQLAANGDLAAIRELMDRLLGRPVEQDLLERIERLEMEMDESDKAAKERT
jgi:hypothetical protein